MALFLGREYNYEAHEASPERIDILRSISHAGERAPDFVLPKLEGGEVRLSALHGTPVMIEFGSIT